MRLILILFNNNIYCLILREKEVWEHLLCKFLGVFLQRQLVLSNYATYSVSILFIDDFILNLLLRPVTGCKRAPLAGAPFRPRTDA